MPERYYTRDYRSVDRSRQDEIEEDRIRNEMGYENRRVSNWTAQRVVMTILWIIEAILGLRFLLVILGANPANPFTSFITALSSPFVAPFRNMFLTGSSVGNVASAVIVAMIVWALIGWAIVAILDSVRYSRARRRYDSFGHCIGPDCPPVR